MKTIKKISTTINKVKYYYQHKSRKIHAAKLYQLLLHYTMSLIQPDLDALRNQLIDFRTAFECQAVVEGTVLSM